MERDPQHKHPTRSRLDYKTRFFLGGAAFAFITYVLGTLIYENESYLLTGEFAIRMDLGKVVFGVFEEHLVTFAPWLFTTTALFAGLGYLFDRQVVLRKVAEDLRMEAESLAVTDGLTRLFNRRYLIDQLAIEVKRTQRHSRTFTLLFLDIDGFKHYNDTHGHQVGDEVLRQIATVTRATARDTDVVARYGGEEFVVIAAGTDKEQGALLADRIRDKVQRRCPVTVSIGVAEFPKDGDSVEQLIEAADQAMYQAKGSGKNRVCIANSEASCSGQAVNQGE